MELLFIAQLSEKSFVGDLNSILSGRAGFAGHGVRRRRDGKSPSNGDGRKRETRVRGVPDCEGDTYDILAIIIAGESLPRHGGWPAYRLAWSSGRAFASCALGTMCLSCYSAK